MEEEYTAAEEQEASRQKLLSSRLSQRSEVAQEIISKKPGFLEEWSLLIFLGILLLLFAGTWFVRYPDIIESRASLTGENAPKEFICRQDGRLISLFKKNNDRVSRNEIIGLIESTADHEDVMELSKQIDSVNKLLSLNQSDKIPKMPIKSYKSLGEIQQVYQQYIAGWQQFDDYIGNGFHVRRKLLLEQDIQSLKAMKKMILKQKGLTEEDTRLAEETFKMNKKLFDDKVLSNEEFRAERSKYVNKEKSISALESSMFSNEMQIREKQKEINQLEHDVLQQKLTFQQSLQSLKSRIDDWIQRYVIKSPVEGQIYFLKSFQANQYVRAGIIMGYINQKDSGYFMETSLPQRNFGKIDTGLQVQLRFDAYPYEEVGFVEGTLNYISTVPSDSGFLATIKLNKGLLTNNNKKLVYRNGLRARALIITKNMRLMERLYYDMVKTTSMNGN